MYGHENSISSLDLSAFHSGCHFWLNQHCIAEVEHKMLVYDNNSRQGFEKYETYDEGMHSYKVFVMGPRKGTTWSYRAELTYEAALNKALSSCRTNNGGRKCKVFAIGDTIVWDMAEGEIQQVVAAYRANRTEVDNPYPQGLESPMTIAAFNDYLAVDDEAVFKVFIKAKRGAFAYRKGSEYGAIVKAATEHCKEGSSAAQGSSGACRLFAVGDTVVWDMSKSERKRAVDAYRKRSLAISEENILTGAEIDVFLPGKTVSGNWEGTEFSQTFFSDGTAEYRERGKAAKRTKWSTDGRYCERSGGRSTCYEVVVDGDTVYFVDEGGKKWETVLTE